MFSLFNKIELRHVCPIVGDIIEQIRTTGLRLMGAQIGRNSIVRKNFYTTNATFLTIGKNSKIGINCQLFLYDKFHVGDNVEIGSNLIVHTAEHILNNVSKPLCKQGSYYKAVLIESDVYIGSRVTILPGTIIENRVVIGAGAVVKGHLKSGYIYCGVPAKPIKKICRDDTNLCNHQ